MIIQQAKKLKEFERENARLKQIVADLFLEKGMWKEVASETGKPYTATGCSDEAYETVWVSQCIAWRIWLAKGLKLPTKQKLPGCLFFNDGARIRRRSKYQNHVWSDDFVSCQTHERRKFQVLMIIAEFTQGFLALNVARQIKAMAVLAALLVLMTAHGGPGIYPVGQWS